jgi:hypothetical protein
MDNLTITELDLDVIESKELIKLALIFTKNRSDIFMKTELMKQTTYTETDIERLTDNYIYFDKLSLKGDK